MVAPQLANGAAPMKDVGDGVGVLISLVRI
jgi:hypothetical protein